ncbi:MAG: HNH endonuclease [Leptolyngbyaceae cyanobacterium RU_5_1]|nr:HNH endonuclease [Leptolyngbyaceae cyanobacterium RU_5_1]
MPMQRDLYPNNWDAIALAVKEESGWSCEFCGSSCMQPGESWTDFLIRMNWTIAHCKVARPRQYMLTCAHLNHIPPNCDRSNLKALCNPCHCRYDLKAMATKQRLKRERLGQLRIKGV